MKNYVDNIEIDVSHIQEMIFVHKSRKLFDYNRKNSRIEKDEKKNEMTIIRKRIKKQKHKEFQMNINRQLIKRYFNVSCKCVMLNEYLDDEIDDKECETN